MRSGYPSSPLKSFSGASASPICARGLLSVHMNRLNITIGLKAGGEGSIVNKAWVIFNHKNDLLAMISSQCF